MNRRWKVLARHKWVTGATITESVDVTKETILETTRRFTATIRGRRGIVIFEGVIRRNIVNQVIQKVNEIKKRIDSGDLSVLKDHKIA